MNSPRRPDGPAIYDGKSYSAAVHLAEDVKPFVAIANGLRARGFSAPAIHHADLDSGFPDHRGFRQRRRHRRRSAAADRRALRGRDRHAGGAASRSLARNGCRWRRRSPTQIPVFDIDAWLVEIGLMLEWYLPDRGVEAQPATCATNSSRCGATLLEQAGGRAANLGDAGLSFAQPDLARRPRRDRARRHHRLPGCRAGPGRLRSGVAAAGRADRRARTARACAADPLHQGAPRGR